MERRLVIDHLKLGYEGLFNAGEVFNVVSNWFFGKHWDWWEKVNEETVTENGKNFRIVLEPWKSISEYYKIAMKIKLHMLDVREVEVEQKGEKLKLQHGVIRITIDGYTFSDRTGKWAVRTRPFMWFLSIIFENYFFKDHLAKAETWIKRDVDDLHQRVKTYLNTLKYTYNA